MLGTAIAAGTGSVERASVVPGSLIRAAGAAAAFDRFPPYRAGMRWLEEFVTQPHPELGRPGPVCPQLAPALRADTVWLVSVAVPGFTAGAAVGAGRLLLRLFDEITHEFADEVADDVVGSAAGARRSAATVLGFFPGLPERAAAGFIDGGHRLLRAEFAERGVMLGEFHAGSSVGGAHNRALPVMRSPVPMYAVRAMTAHDLLFADQPGTTPAEREGFLLAYQRHLGPWLSSAARDRLIAALAAVRTAAHSGDRS
jgi:Domain of unknown function (DUF6875)